MEPMRKMKKSFLKQRPSAKGRLGLRDLVDLAAGELVFCEVSVLGGLDFCETSAPDGLVLRGAATSDDLVMRIL